MRRRSTASRTRWFRWSAWALVPAIALSLGPAGTAGAGDRPAVVPGTATATAKSYAFAIGLNGGIGGGGASLGLNRGISASDARDDTAVTKGIALDLGLIASFNRLPTAECPEITPLFDPATLPPIVQAESGDPASASPRPGEVRFPGLEGPGPVAGIQDATAGPGATGAARTEAPEGFGPFVGAVGLRSETTSSVTPDGKRRATSTVTAESIDVAGVFTIGKPRFSAVSAGDGTSAATFTYDWVYFLGQFHGGAAAARALQDGKALVEGLFGLLGLKVDLPVGTVTTKQNPSSDTTFLETVELTPLRVRLSNIPITRDLLGPILQALGPDIDRALADYLSDPCADQGLSNVVTIARGLLGGDGELGTALGAVTASTSDRWVAPPPPPTTVPTVPEEQPVVELSTEVAGTATGRTDSGDFRGSFTSTTSGSGGSSSIDEVVPDTAPPVEEAVDEAPAEVAAAAPLRAAPASKSITSRGGPLLWAALALLAGVGAVALADRLVLAKRRSA